MNCLNDTCFNIARYHFILSLDLKTKFNEILFKNDVNLMPSIQITQ